MITSPGNEAGDLALLLFQLHGERRFGVNLLKVREVAHRPALVRVADMPPPVIGVCRLREETLPVIDLNEALDLGPAPEAGLIMVCHFARQAVGFLIDGVQDILSVGWTDVQPPPAEAGGDQLLTGVVSLDRALIQIPDLERVLADLLPPDLAASTASTLSATVLVVDDSSLARRQIETTLDALGVRCIMAGNGLEALETLEKRNSPVDALIVDVEMPQLDGYTLVRRLREHPVYRDSAILMHSSLEGTASEEKGLAAGADNVLTKFDAEMLASNLEQLLELKRSEPQAHG